MIIDFLKEKFSDYCNNLNIFIFHVPQSFRPGISPLDAVSCHTQNIQFFLFFEWGLNLPLCRVYTQYILNSVDRSSVRHGNKSSRY